MSGYDADSVDLGTLFHDHTPIPQDDGPHPVCAIDYSPSFTEAMDYLRAVLRADERSERALKLTAICLKLNPANYTIWHFRRRCLAALSISEEGDGLLFDPTMVEEDLQLAAKLGGSNPKNYQIWYHRRALLEPTLSPSDTSEDKKANTVDVARKELLYVASVLGDDAKNYHAWSHRQWIVRTVNRDDLWQEEKVYAHKLILDDPRNNSAWNQRWFAAHRGTHVPLTMDDATEEADYAIQGATIDPYNESPWRYLIGVIKEQISVAKQTEASAEGDSGATNAASMMVNEFEKELVKTRDALNKTEYEVEGCANLTSAHIDLLEFKGDPESLQLAAELAHGLACQHDKIRTKYWLLRERELRSALAP